MRFFNTVNEFEIQGNGFTEALKHQVRKGVIHIAKYTCVVYLIKW